MKVVFRADASLEIGTGHVMRCLTLADQLKMRNIQSYFVCRNHQGNFATLIEQSGYEVSLLPLEQTEVIEGYSPSNNYSDFLGAPAVKDAQKTADIAGELNAAWLINDHYGIDSLWEKIFKANTTNIKVLAIDGQANRFHDYEILVDPTLSIESEKRWEALLPTECLRLVGPKYALLRPEFNNLKVIKKFNSNVATVFVNFGGIDKKNVTELVINALLEIKSIELKLEVLLGKNNPNIPSLKAKFSSNQNVVLHLQPPNVAEVMAMADIAISAGGSTIWELCKIAIPTLLITTAPNQVQMAKALDAGSYVKGLGDIKTMDFDHLKTVLINLISDKTKMITMSRKAQSLMKAPKLCIVDHIIGVDL